MKKLDKMNMKGKISYGYVLVIGMMAVLAVLSVVGLFFLNGKINAYINGAQAADTAVKMCRIEANNAARNIREMALADKSAYDGYKEKIQTSIDALHTNLDGLKQTDMLEQSLYEQYEDVVTDWITIGNQIVDDLEAGEKETATKAILEECSPALQSVIDVAKEIDKVTDEEKTDAIQQSMYTVIFDSVLIAAALAGAILIAVKVGKRIIRGIVEPVKEIENAAIEMSRGNLRTEITYHSEDEIGKLAHGLRSSIDTLHAYIEDIDMIMRSFSEGNFDVQTSAEWKGDFVSISESFLGFERNMAEVVKNIQRVSDQVASASEQVSASSMELAQGATDQAGITEELTATIETISERIHQNADSARSISSDVSAVGVEIVNSNGKMQEMVKSMNEISQSSNEISKIIATINDIANQTNLLALNASIEAARAGEAGKGFAVVADQVSVLAAQSAEAAKESTALIESSVRAVGNGMVIADETARQLENVVNGSKEITEKVNQIAIASEEQAESISQINDGVEHINEVVQTNSATSEECAASSQEMTGQAETLEGLIRQFKVGKF